MTIESANPKQVIEPVEPGVEQPSRNLALLGLIGLLGVFVASVLFRPPASEYFTVCGFKNLTGLPCPGCGLTHSFCALAKGELTDAFAFNLLGPPLFLVLVVLWIRSALVLMNQTAVVERMDRIGERLNLIRRFALAFVVYGIARIVYLLVFSQAAYDGSPLSRLLARLIQ